MVELVKKEVVVTKEASEVADLLVSLVKSIKQHNADGFQAGQDIPAVLMENFNAFIKGVEGVGKLPDEGKENLPAFLNAFGFAASEIATTLLTKEVKAE